MSELSEPDSTSGEVSTSTTINPFGLPLLTRPPPLYRGVFTHPTQTIPAGQTIEVSPVLVLEPDEWENHGRKTVLDHYAFVWGRTGRMAVALGLGSLFNHSPTPNVSFIRSMESSTIRYITCKTIPPSTELTINYGPEDALWFEPVYSSESSPSPSSSCCTNSIERKEGGRKSTGSSVGSPKDEFLAFLSIGEEQEEQEKQEEQQEEQQGGQ